MLSEEITMPRHSRQDVEFQEGYEEWQYLHSLRGGGRGGGGRGEGEEEQMEEEEGRRRQKRRS